MNGEVCCILGICCPPESEERVEALAREIGKAFECSHDDAKRFARWMIKNFTLAPKSLQPFVNEIIKHAKGEHL